MRSSNGWYAVVVGPYPAEYAKSRRDFLKQQNLVPSDAALSRGEMFVSKLWDTNSTGDGKTIVQFPPVAVAAKPSGTEPAPSVAGGQSTPTPFKADAHLSLVGKWTRVERTCSQYSFEIKPDRIIATNVPQNVYDPPRILKSEYIGNDVGITTSDGYQEYKISSDSIQLTKSVVKNQDLMKIIGSPPSFKKCPNDTVEIKSPDGSVGASYAQPSRSPDEIISNAIENRNKLINDFITGDFRGERAQDYCSGIAAVIHFKILPLRDAWHANQLSSFDWYVQARDFFKSLEANNYKAYMIAETAINSISGSTGNDAYVNSTAWHLSCVARLEGPGLRS
ncbi:hypothetical protein ACS5PV_24430 [Methylobacterium sp. Gmos1]